MPADRPETCRRCGGAITSRFYTPLGTRELHEDRYCAAGCGEHAPATPPAHDEADPLMPKDVPGAAEFRDAFKKAVPPRGADHVSWVNGYCAGWIACEKAFPRDDQRARDAVVERAAEAIYHADYFGGDTLPTLDFRKDAPFSAMAETTKAEYRLLARAAINAALRGTNRPEQGVADDQGGE